MPPIWWCATAARISGEHGDGKSRSALLPKMFGPELMSAFGEFKAIWDPGNNLNPHNIVDAQPATEHLRLGADYAPSTPATHFKFPDDGGSLASATLRCIGIGECRKQDAGTMCPSYMATLEEEHSTRGRAHMLSEMLRGDVLHGGWNDEQVKHSLDLCLSCKACKSECPTNVDIATYRAEFLSHYYERHRRPLHAYAFGMVNRWLSLASIAPGFANLLMQAPGVSHIMKKALDVAPQRTLPRLAPSGFRKRARAQQRADEWRRRDPVGGHVQQLVPSGDQPGGARGADRGRLQGVDSRAAALLRPAAVRLWPHRSRGRVSAEDPHGARRSDRRRHSDRRPRAELRLGVQG